MLFQRKDQHFLPEESRTDRPIPQHRRTTTRQLDLQFQSDIHNQPPLLPSRTTKPVNRYRVLEAGSGGIFRINPSWKYPLGSAKAHLADSNAAPITEPIPAFALYAHEECMGILAQLNMDEFFIAQIAMSPELSIATKELDKNQHDRIAAWVRERILDLDLDFTHFQNVLAFDRKIVIMWPGHGSYDSAAPPGASRFNQASIGVANGAAYAFEDEDMWNWRFLKGEEYMLPQVLSGRGEGCRGVIFQQLDEKGDVGEVLVNRVWDEETASSTWEPVIVEMNVTEPWDVRGIGAP